MNREIKFRIRMENRETGEALTIYNQIFDAMNGVAFYEIDRKFYKFLGADEYAGKNDNNEREIYEGDILSDKWKVVVYRCKDTGAFMVRFGTNPKGNKPRTLYKYLKSRELAGAVETDCIKIGNIHDNPELLK